ncbi:MAG: carbohydrate kinase family protein [Candidatus Nanopelagicales bacterium]
MTRAPRPDRRFVSVGQYMTDVVASLPSALREGTDTPADVRVMGGGAAANTAAWLAHDGHASTFAGRIGDDLLGRAGRRELEDGGVTCVVAVDPLRPTGTCIVLVMPDGERTMVPDPGANQALTPQDLGDDLFAAGSHLHLSGYTLMVDSSRMAGLSALDRARLRGMTTSVDVASVGPLADTGAARFLSWVSGVDVLLANEEEAAFLAGLPAPVEEVDAEAALAAAHEAARLLLASAGTVVVKLGHRGSLAHDREQGVAFSPAVPVDVLDTTGAGDAFAAGFLPAWCDGVELDVALGRGNRAAARVVGRVGARP